MNEVLMEWGNEEMVKWKNENYHRPFQIIVNIKHLWRGGPLLYDNESNHWQEGGIVEF